MNQRFRRQVGEGEHLMSLPSNRDKGFFGSANEIVFKPVKTHGLKSHLEVRVSSGPLKGKRLLIKETPLGGDVLWSPYTVAVCSQSAQRSTNLILVRFIEHAKPLGRYVFKHNDDVKERFSEIGRQLGTFAANGVLHQDLARAAWLRPDHVVFGRKESGVIDWGLAREGTPHEAKEHYLNALSRLIESSLPSPFRRIAIDSFNESFEKAFKARSS